MWAKLYFLVISNNFKRRDFHFLQEVPQVTVQNVNYSVDVCEVQILYSYNVPETEPEE